MGSMYMGYVSKERDRAARRSPVCSHSACNSHSACSEGALTVLVGSSISDSGCQRRVKDVPRTRQGHAVEPVLKDQAE